MTLLLGAIADDLTGATELANTLLRKGMPQCNSSAHQLVASSKTR